MVPDCVAVQLIVLLSGERMPKTSAYVRSIERCSLYIDAEDLQIGSLSVKCRAMGVQSKGCHIRPRSPQLTWKSERGLLKTATFEPGQL